MKILVVDAYPLSARALTRLLAIQGHDVFAAPNLRAAEALCAATGAPTFDLLITDLDLPDGSGGDLLRRLCLSTDVNAARTPMRSIAFGDGVTQADRLASREAGFDELLDKPARFEELEAIISRLSVHGGTTAA